MRTIYHWAMRNGSQLLFAFSAFLFLIGLGQGLVGLKDLGPGSMSSGALSPEAFQLLLLLSGLSAAISGAVLPFIGAVLIHRWDVSRRNQDIEASRREEV